MAVAEITVSDVSEDVLACLEAQAKANHRSLESKSRHLLARHARRSGIEGFRERTAQLCALTADRPQTDSVALLREDRRRYRYGKARVVLTVICATLGSTVL